MVIFTWADETGPAVCLSDNGTICAGGDELHDIEEKTDSHYVVGNTVKQ